MIAGFGDEIRLLFALLLNAAVLVCAWRAARRWNSDRLDAAGDCLLIYYLIQYLAVCGTGLAGMMSAGAIALLAILMSAALWIGSRRRPEAIPPASHGCGSKYVRASAICFVIAYLVALIWHQRQLPVMSNDAITYQLPAAVQWLQTRRLALYPAWFYNPANSYSPLAGSAFIAWLIAPMGSDVLARFVEIGPLVLVFVALLNLCRRMGVSDALATVVAAAAVLSRPFMTQAILAKDDLFATAFFILALDGMSRSRLTQRIGPWRIGVALGLLLATKYTVLLSAPILLLAIGGGWNWRRIGIVALVAMILAGPWYLRNWLLTDNPLYPTTIRLARVTIFHGMITATRSDLLKTFAGVWHVFTGGYFGMPLALAIVLLIGWASAIAFDVKKIAFTPMLRAVVIGPVIGIGLFITLAPYGEMRFAYPSIALLFVALGLILNRLPSCAGCGIAVAIMLTAAMTAFWISMAGLFTIAALIASMLAILVIVLADRGWPMKRAIPYACAVASLIVMTAAYVDWTAYVQQCEMDSTIAWASPNVYGSIADVWEYVRDTLPRGAKLAYANTFFTYPLMGYNYDHRVVYVPTRRGLDQFAQMPPIDRPMTGEQIVGNIVALLRQNPDEAQWLARLRVSGAKYLIVAKHDPAKPSELSDPPELVFVSIRSNHFQRVFDNDAGSVFRINW